MNDMDVRTMADAYEFIRVTHELALQYTLAMEALITVMTEDDPKFLPRFQAALEAAKGTEGARALFQSLANIDSLIATLRSSSSQIGTA